LVVEIMSTKLEVAFLVKAEYVRGYLNNKYPQFTHIECEPTDKKAKWKSYLMNDFFKDTFCSRCGVKLQCKCSPFKVSEANTGDCKH
jgi:hypothetical protein